MRFVLNIISISIFVDEREIENSRMIEDRRKAVEEIEFAFQLRELQLTRLLEESNSQLQNKVGVKDIDFMHWYRMLSRVCFDI